MDVALCPLCLASADAVDLAGEKGHLCSECDAVILHGPSVQALAVRGISARELKPEVRKALVSTEQQTDLHRLARGLSPCSFCKGPREAFRFGGGTAPAVRCRRCERVAFPRGALALAIEEQRGGSKMTADQKDALRGLRMGSALGRHLKTDVVVIGLMAGGLAVLMRLGVVLPGWAFAVVAVVIGGYVLMRIRGAKAEEREAEDQVERMAEAEAVDKKKKARRGKAAAAIAGGYCAWCGGKLAPNATRCDACDTDFG
ncbi:MAG: hypothetical protein HOV80_08410 [Polyangiaceae bacterium]|nr:hypothetical protein [Polyangiaceae bacterium]